MSLLINKSVQISQNNKIYHIIRCNFIEMNPLVHESDIAFVSQVSFSNNVIY